MAFLFGRNKQRGAIDLCKVTKELLLKLNSDEPTPPKVEEDLAKNLAQMKLTVQGTPEQETSPQAVHQLVEYLATEGVLLPLARSLRRLSFDARKDAQAIFCSVFRFRVPAPTPSGPNQHPLPSLPNKTGEPENETDPLISAHIINDSPEIITSLCLGYDYRESALACGNILREALKHDSMAALILYDEPLAEGQKHPGLKGVDPNIPGSGNGVFWRFFDWMDKSVFEVSADAFTTFSELLKRHKRLTSHYLLTNYTRFTQTYNTRLIQSPSYVTKRQSIKLLAELLLERANYTLMTQYISSAPHLKLSMALLRDDGRMVQYEAFHIFKVFVANPNKSEEVRRIFVMNREKLLRFLPGFLESRGDEDLQFKDEKAYCLRQIEALPSLPPPQQQQSSTAGSGGSAGGGGSNSNSSSGVINSTAKQTS